MTGLNNVLSETKQTMYDRMALNDIDTKEIVSYDL